MKKFWFSTAALIAFSGSMFADTIWAPTSTGTLTAVPATTAFSGSNTATFTGNGTTTNPTNGQTPFWNNPSADTTGLVTAHVGNVGEVLAGLATGTSPLPAADVTAGNINGMMYGTASGNGDPVSGTAPGSVSGLPGSEAVKPALEFNFFSALTAMQVSVLFADSTQDTGSGSPMATTFGTYIVPGGGSIQTFQLGGGIANTTTPTTLGSLASNFFNNGTVYGFYATVCYHVTGSTCDQSVTYTTGAGNYSTNIGAGSNFLGALGWNHFAFFELADGEWALGFEDSPYQVGTANAVESIGDFNDVVFGITGNTSQVSTTPEPGTIAILGMGLAGLGMLGRRRFAK